MYYPYFRGKQFELIALRESAELIADAAFVPVIEPVRKSLDGLKKSLLALSEFGAHSIVIVNPRHGDHKNSGDSILELLKEDFAASGNVSPGVLLTPNMDSSKAVHLVECINSNFSEVAPSLIHYGFGEAKELAERIRDLDIRQHIFLESHTNIIYQRHFREYKRILISDGFKQMRNADYDPIEAFSDLHLTFDERGMDGYGDFLTVGDTFSEGGGPAYAVAIHITFINPDEDNVMFICHFISDTNDTPTNPGGKFSQALNKLIDAINMKKYNIIKTSAIEEFIDFHNRGHFPGLGYVKKLSIKHHLETLANFS